MDEDPPFIGRAAVLAGAAGVLAGVLVVCAGVTVYCWLRGRLY